MTEILNSKAMVSSLKGGGDGPEAATASAFLGAGAGGATFPSNFLKNNTENATEYKV